MESENSISVVVTGANRVELVERLRAFADNLDGAPATISGKATKSQARPAASSKKAAVAEEEDDGFVAKEDTGEPDGFGDDATAADDAAGDGEDFTEEPPKKSAAKGTKAKAKKITLDDVNDACKAHAQANGRKATLETLQKKFKTQSVTALKPEQYEACISAMAVN